MVFLGRLTPRLARLGSVSSSDLCQMNGEGKPSLFPSKNHKMVNLPQDLEERLERSGLSELDLEEACCNYVSLLLGVDPHMSRRKVYELKGLAVYEHDVDNDRPIWLDHIYHVMAFIEMTQAVSVMRSSKAHRQLDEVLRWETKEPPVAAPN